MITLIGLAALLLSTGAFFDDGISSLPFIVDFILSILEKDLECKGKTYENVSLTAYFPDYDGEELEDSIYDKRGKKLKTLQVFLKICVKVNI